MSPPSICAHAVRTVLDDPASYDRLALLAGFVAHILWGYGLYFAVQRYIRHRIAIVPFGDVERLNSIGNVDWHLMREPSLDDATGCDGLVADFTARDMPPEWEALAGRCRGPGPDGLPVKQLSESLTGRVAIDHLVGEQLRQPGPARGYFHLKSLADYVLAIAAADCPYGGGGDRRAIKLTATAPAVPAARVGCAASRLRCSSSAPWPIESPTATSMR
jgi:hypothetical protein